MPKPRQTTKEPKLMRADYMWCAECECAVPKKKAEKYVPFFSDEAETLRCPFCSEELQEFGDLAAAAEDPEAGDEGAARKKEGEGSESKNGRLRFV